MFTSTPTILCTSLASYNPVPNQVAKSTTSQQTTALPPTNAQTQTDNSNEIETQTDVLPIEPFVLNEKRGLQAIESLVSKALLSNLRTQAIFPRQVSITSKVAVSLRTTFHHPLTPQIPVLNAYATKMLLCHSVDYSHKVIEYHIQTGRHTIYTIPEAPSTLAYPQEQALKKSTTTSQFVAGLVSGHLHNSVKQSRASHQEPVSAIAWGERLYSASTSGEVITWSADLDELERTVYTLSQIPRSLRPSAVGKVPIGLTSMVICNVLNTLILGSETGLLFRKADPLFMYTCTHPYAGVVSLACPPPQEHIQSHLFASCSADHTFRIYHALESAALRILDANGLGLSISWSKDGFIACGGEIFHQDHEKRLISVAESVKEDKENTTINSTGSDLIYTMIWGRRLCSVTSEAAMIYKIGEHE